MDDKNTTKLKATGDEEEPYKKKARMATANNDGREITYEIDLSYKYSKMKIEKSEEPLQFSPAYFLRTHSKNNDPADVQTQIWQCSFEPHLEKNNAYTNTVATCGGTSVCFIDINTGEVTLKYNRNAKVAATENLYAVAWSSLPLDDLGMKKINILAAGGGSRSTVVLLHPEEGCCYQLFRTNLAKSAAAVCSLLFHPKKATWLFCGHNDGHIQIWDVGVPPLPSYDVTPVQLINIPNKGKDVYNMVYSQTMDLLIGGCEQGLFAWNIDFNKIEQQQRLECTEFCLPDPDKQGTVVDSICLIDDDTIAAKCVLHGYIYVFNIKEVLKGKIAEVKDNPKKTQTDVILTKDSIVKLSWSDTDNYYMNMGADFKSCVLACGDDKGTLWIYDLFSVINGDISSPLIGEKSLRKPIEANLKLEWPDLEDAEVEKARKLRLDSHDIVIDKCAVSFDAQHIVAVTSNNMVCIWHRKSDEDED